MIACRNAIQDLLHLHKVPEESFRADMEALRRWAPILLQQSRRCI